MKKIERIESFQKQLEHLLNSKSMENGSNTPDFILAKYMNACLHAFTTAVNRREDWYGRKKKISAKAFEEVYKKI